MNPMRVLAACAALLLVAGCASAPARRFATPEQAVAAFAAAAKSGSTPALVEILGEDGRDLVDSGDAVVDADHLAIFTGAFERKHSLAKEADGRLTLVLGEKEWPFPIPLVADGGGWRFDPAAGRDEILSRRIGRNELNAIQVCLALADAQQDYAQLRVDGTAQYARKIISDPGRRNGLFWKTAPGEPPSPLGELIAQAAEEGYTGTASQQGTYHGYRYRGLARQGAAARGGERDYVIDGKMIGGFAFIAFPADYGNSGIMSFLVNHDGTVYQADLGEDTVKAASRLEAFDPGKGWTAVPGR